MRSRTALWISLLALSVACRRGAPEPSPSATSVPPRAQASTAQQSEAPLGAERARHLLQRATFGPTKTELNRVASLTLTTWLDEVLSAKPHSDVSAADRHYGHVLQAPSALARAFQRPEMSSESQEEVDAPDEDTMTYGADMTAPDADTTVPGADTTVPGADTTAPGADMTAPDGKPPARMPLQLIERTKLLLTLQMAQLSRHVESVDPVREVMADFWASHFNVQASKGNIPLSAPGYLMGLRARALGRFEELLTFTATHPAMLVYLDNALSVALPPKRQARAANPFRGLNENYARELLELHTLGVDGGYSQTDVRETARVLTGWGILREADGGARFQFNDRHHDQGDKTVLGHTYSADGEREGHTLLGRLAQHPSTARFLAKKLCRRFVADEPSAACVETTAKAYLDNDTSIAATLRALFASDAFWDESVRDGKYKTPVEFWVSAARVLSATPDGSLRLARRVMNMGEGLWRFPSPTGYPETADAWLSTGGIWSRMEQSALMLRGKPVGLNVDFEALYEDEETPEAVLARAEELVLTRPASAATHAAALKQLQTLPRPRQRRWVALALLLGSPEFQRQ